MHGRHRYLTYWLAIMIATLWVDAAVAGSKRAVAELFTSQGCSSCPPADALAGQLATVPAVLVLSFHVNYWDGPAWKDPFSSKASTDRQYGYLRSLGGPSVFTPQLIVNGMRSVVGSEVAAVKQAVAVADQESFSVKADLEKQPDGSFKLTLAGPPQRGDIWAVEYIRHSLTKIRGGENGGRSLETFNDVTRIQRIGDFNPGTLNVQPLAGGADGLAILVQAPRSGRILGAAAY
jgi:hypothetical protein